MYIMGLGVLADAKRKDVRLMHGSVKSGGRRANQKSNIVVCLE